jgi:hypothetical protein
VRDSIRAQSSGRQSKDGGKQWPRHKTARLMMELDAVHGEQGSWPDQTPRRCHGQVGHREGGRAQRWLRNRAKPGAPRVVEHRRMWRVRRHRVDEQQGRVPGQRW